MPDTAAARPLLTIAIPTFNRSASLSALLTVLAPQLAGHPEVELLISDNGSPDDTEAVMRGFIAEGLKVRYIRQSENIGSDRNFVACFENARGVFFWLCGDDDIILPGTLDRILPHLAGEKPLDLLYATSYGFREDWVAERQEDRFRRRFHTFTDPLEFAKVVNVMFTFISAMVVNRGRLLELPHEAPAALLNTNLVQLGWCLPLLLNHRRSVVLWDRAVAGRQGNAGGYAIGKVFGQGLKDTLARLLPGRKDLQDAILNPAVRRWLPSALYAIRAEENRELGLATAEQELRLAYGGDARFWIFAWPVLRLWLPLARLWFKAGVAANVAIYMLTVPGFWRKQS